jgi:hypothetical protein
MIQVNLCERIQMDSRQMKTKPKYVKVAVGEGRGRIIYHTVVDEWVDDTHARVWINGQGVIFHIDEIEEVD